MIAVRPVCAYWHATRSTDALPDTPLPKSGDIFVAAAVLQTNGLRAQAGVPLRLSEARAVAARAVAAAVGYAGAQDAETLTLAMRVRSQSLT